MVAPACAAITAPKLCHLAEAPGARGREQHGEPHLVGHVVDDHGQLGDARRTCLPCPLRTTGAGDTTRRGIDEVVGNSRGEYGADDSVAIRPPRGAVGGQHRVLGFDVAHLHLIERQTPDSVGLDV